MTICVAVKVHDCLVFAADSATSLVGVDDQGRPAIVNVYNHGNKVFNLVKRKPICAMTCGMGHIGRSSISTLAKDLRHELSAKPEDGGLDLATYTIEEVAGRAKAFLFDKRYQEWADRPVGDHSLEFFVGGFSAGGEQPEVWKLVLANGECADPIRLQVPDDRAFIAWSGQPEAINRLIMGYGQALPGALADLGMAPEVVDQTVAHIQSYTATALAADAMPIGDAIGLAQFLVDTTKGYVHYLMGANTVGGDTDVATVTRHEGFRWIQRKHHYPRDLNLETDHE